MVQAEDAGSSAAGWQQEDRAALFPSRYRAATQRI